MTDVLSNSKILSVWFRTNRLFSKLRKQQINIISISISQLLAYLSIAIDNETIGKSIQCKILRRIIDAHLTWNEHTAIVHTKKSKQY